MTAKVEPSDKQRDRETAGRIGEKVEYGEGFWIDEIVAALAAVREEERACCAEAVAREREACEDVAESRLAASEREVERLQVYHADDEPSWRHRAEALEAKTEHERRELQEKLAAAEADLADALVVIRRAEVQIRTLEEILATPDPRDSQLAEKDARIASLEETVKTFEEALGQRRDLIDRAFRAEATVAAQAAEVERLRGGA